MTTMRNSLRELPPIAAFLRFCYQFAQACVWIYEKIIGPLWGTLIWRPFRYLFSKYRHYVWEDFVYRNDGRFSKTRAGVLLTGTIVFLYCLPQVLLFVFHGLLFATTLDRRVVYLTQPQEIFPEENIHAVRGCEEIQCTDQNTIYYRVRPHFFHEAWSILTGRGMFYPDYVASAVPPGMSECTTLSYGFRIKFLMRNADIYPDLLEVSCKPLVHK